MKNAVAQKTSIDHSHSATGNLNISGLANEHNQIGKINTPSETKISSHRGNSANNKLDGQSPNYNKNNRKADVNKTHNQMLRSQDLKKNN